MSLEVHDQTMMSIISTLHSQMIVCHNNSSKECDWWNQLRTRARVNTSFQVFVFHAKAHHRTWTVSDELSACALNAELTQRKARLRCSRNRVDFLRKWFGKEERSVWCVKTFTETYASHWGFPFRNALLYCKRNLMFFSTVHHSIESFHLPALMYNSLFINNMYVTLLSSICFEH